MKLQDFMNDDTCQILFAIIVGIIICYFIFGSCSSGSCNRDGFSVGGPEGGGTDADTGPFCEDAGGTPTDLDERTSAVTTECCGTDDGPNNCPNGLPEECNNTCAQVYLPYYNDCKNAFPQSEVDSLLTPIQTKCQTPTQTPTLPAQQDPVCFGNQKLTDVQTQFNDLCCSQSNSNCTNGIPNSCDPACLASLTAYNNNCSGTLQVNSETDEIAKINAALTNCSPGATTPPTVSPPPPPTVLTCTDTTIGDRVTAVQTACCPVSFLRKNECSNDTDLPIRGPCDAPCNNALSSFNADCDGLRSISTYDTYFRDIDDAVMSCSTQPPAGTAVTPPPPPVVSLADCTSTGQFDKFQNLESICDSDKDGQVSASECGPQSQCGITYRSYKTQCEQQGEPILRDLWRNFETTCNTQPGGGSIIAPAVSPPPAPVIDTDTLMRQAVKLMEPVYNILIQNFNGSRTDSTRVSDKYYAYNRYLNAHGFNTVMLANSSVDQLTSDYTKKTVFGDGSDDLTKVGLMINGSKSNEIVLGNIPAAYYSKVKSMGLTTDQEISEFCNDYSHTYGSDQFIDSLTMNLTQAATSGQTELCENFSISESGDYNNTMRANLLNPSLTNGGLSGSNLVSTDYADAITDDLLSYNFAVVETNADYIDASNASNVDSVQIFVNYKNGPPDIRGTNKASTQNYNGIVVGDYGLSDSTTSADRLQTGADGGEALYTFNYLLMKEIFDTSKTLPSDFADQKFNCQGGTCSLDLIGANDPARTDPGAVCSTSPTSIYGFITAEVVPNGEDVQTVLAYTYVDPSSVESVLNMKFTMDGNLVPITGFSGTGILYPLSDGVIFGEATIGNLPNIKFYTVSTPRTKQNEFEKIYSARCNGSDNLSCCQFLLEQGQTGVTLSVAQQTMAGTCEQDLTSSFSPPAGTTVTPPPPPGGGTGPPPPTPVLPVVPVTPGAGGTEGRLCMSYNDKQCPAEKPDKTKNRYKRVSTGETYGEICCGLPEGCNGLTNTVTDLVMDINQSDASYSGNACMVLDANLGMVNAMCQPDQGNADISADDLIDLQKLQQCCACQN